MNKNSDEFKDEKNTKNEEKMNLSASEKKMNLSASEKKMNLSANEKKMKSIEDQYAFLS